MKKMLRLLLLIVFSVATFIIFSSRAFAAAPATLLIFTSYQPWLSPNRTPVDVGGFVQTVTKTTTNGIRIPISASPYDGNMLESTGNNVDPDTNSVLWGTGGDVYNAAFAKLYQLIWCGNSAGVPNGEFQADVSINFQNGEYIDDTSLIINGVKKRGQWKGYWYRDLGNNEKTPNQAFTGRKARVAAFNPYNTVVSFTFVEDAPTNAMLIRKYSPSTHPADGKINNVSPIINSSNIDLYYKDATNIWRKTDSSKANPTLFNPLLAFYSYYIDVEVPQGWDLKKATIKNQAADVTGCRQVGSSKYCKIGLPGINFSVGFSLADIVNIDLWFDTVALTQGDLNCVAANDGNYYWVGWGIDMANQPKAPQIKVYEGSQLLETLYGNVSGAETQRIRSNNTAYPNASDSTPYDIKVPLGESFHSNIKRNLTYKLVINNGADEITLGQDTVGLGTDCNEPYFYPWLQTKQGNVVANGQINGQQDSPNLLGSIRSNFPSGKEKDFKEAEFLVISSVGGGGPFCSVYNYILTNEYSSSSCSNGTGYSVLNNPSLNIGDKDAVVQATLKAYSDIKSNNNGCAQDKTSQDMSKNSIDTSDCSSGAVYKLTGGNSLGIINVKSGRVTIFVDGDLNINGDITTSTSLVPLSQLPSIAIVANGKINIAPGVTTIDAVLYGADKIDTCSDPNSVNCKQPLLINGMLVGKNGFSFDRTYYNELTPSPAELVIFSPLSTVQVPPGIDSLYYRSVSSVPYKLDTSEYSPRF